MVPSAAPGSTPPVADRTALIWGCFVAEFLGVVIRPFSYGLSESWAEVGQVGERALQGWRSSLSVNQKSQ